MSVRRGILGGGISRKEFVDGGGLRPFAVALYGGGYVQQWASAHSNAEQWAPDNDDDDVYFIFRFIQLNKVFI